MVCYYSTYQRRGGVGGNWFDVIVLTKEVEGSELTGLIL